MLNRLLEKFRLLKGDPEAFKNVLYKFLSDIPNQPERDWLNLQERMEDERLFNSIIDWVCYWIYLLYCV